MPTPSGPGQAGTQWQIHPDNWGCVTIINSGGGGHVRRAVRHLRGTGASHPVMGHQYTANIRSGPPTAGTIQWTASAGQSLTLICYDPNGQ